MNKYPLGSGDESQYASLTPEEKQAWLFPLSDSYHSFHVERMGPDTFRWRDSRGGLYYIGSHFELSQEIFAKLKQREADPRWAENATTVSLLSQEEIDDLLSDL